MSHQSRPSPFAKTTRTETSEMPKGTVPGGRREELSADCQRDFLGVCARQVCNPGLKHILIPIVPYSITFDSLCIFALAEILSKQFVQTS